MSISAFSWRLMKMRDGFCRLKFWAQSKKTLIEKYEALEYDRDWWRNQGVCNSEHINYWQQSCKYYRGKWQEAVALLSTENAEKLLYYPLKGELKREGSDTNELLQEALKAVAEATGTDASTCEQPSSAPPPPNRTRAVFQKYIVSRPDDRSIEGQQFFVLRLDAEGLCGVASRRAARMYASTMKSEEPDLAKDLLARCRKLFVASKGIME